jgi:peptidylprolyl isomerase
MKMGFVKHFTMLVVLLICGLITTPLFAASTALTKDKTAMDLENTLYIDIPYGRIVIAMRPDLAPTHVARIKELARQGFYDNVPFHRVIEGFMAQTGDPTGTGTSGSGKKLKAEFTPEAHLRGTVSMARAGSPDSADSQFFICLADAPHLNGQYTVWGKVVSGMEAVDQIRKGEAYANGTVNDPTKMLTVRVAVDAERDAAKAAAKK